MAEKLEFDISVKSNELSKALNEASSKANALSSHFEGGLKPSIDASIEATKNINKEMSTFSSTALGVAAGQFAFNALTSAIGFLKASIADSISAYSESEDAINKLNQSLNLTGSYSQSASDDVQRFSSEIQANSKYSDEAVLSQFNFAKSLGLTTEQSKQLTSASINLSAQLGFSLEESTTKLAKTLSGELPKGLKALIPELKSLTQEQLKNGDAAKIVNEKYSGSAANELNTYSGQVAALKNSYNDLQERVGENIVKSGIWQGAMQTLKKAIDEINNSSKTEKTLIDNANGSASASSKTREQLANDYVGLTKRIEELNKRYAELAEEERRTGEMSLIESTMSTKMKIKEIETTRDLINEKLQYQKLSTPQQVAEGTSEVEKSKEQKDAISKRNADLLALNEQYTASVKANADREAISKINNETLRNEEEITRLYNQEIKKAEVIATQKEASLSISLDAETKQASLEIIEAEKKLATIDAYGKKEQAQRNNLLSIRKSSEDAMAAYDKKMKDVDLKNQEEFLNNAASLSKSKNKELAAIGKAAAITQIAIKTPPAIASSFEFGTKLGGPALGFALGGVAAIAMAAQAASIAGVAFEQGGIVGSLTGASTGPDNRVAQIRDGEMVLNANDQKTLFDAIKSGSFGGGNIQLIIDGREIAYAVRSQVQGGFRLA